jgi:hypothetical protein
MEPDSISASQSIVVDADGGRTTEGVGQSHGFYARAGSDLPKTMAFRAYRQVRGVTSRSTLSAWL